MFRVYTTYAGRIDSDGGDLGHIYDDRSFGNILRFRLTIFSHSFRFEKINLFFSGFVSADDRIPQPDGLNCFLSTHTHTHTSVQVAECSRNYRYQTIVVSLQTAELSFIWRPNYNNPHRDFVAQRCTIVLIYLFIIAAAHVRSMFRAYRVSDFNSVY